MNRVCLEAANIMPSEVQGLKGDARLRLRPGACIAARSLPGACRHCADACSVQALRMAGEGPALAGSCMGCGRCAGACPTGALSVEGFESHFPLPIGNNLPAVDCWKVPPALSGARAVRVPCLAGVGTEQMLEWAGATDCAPMEILDRGWCAGCTAGGGENPAATLAQAAAALLAECGVPAERLPRLVRSPLPIGLMPAEIPQPLSQARVDRRGFFRRLGAEAAATLAPASGGARPPLRRNEGCALPKRERLLGAARTLAARYGRPAPASLFPALQVSPDCDHGSGCVTLCPTGALQSYAADGCAGTEFDADACVACGLCVRACRKQALALTPTSDLPPSARQTLTRFDLRRCAACTQPFAGIGEHTLCPECRRDRQMARQLFATQAANP